MPRTVSGEKPSTKHCTPFAKNGSLISATFASKPSRPSRRARLAYSMIFSICSSGVGSLIKKLRTMTFTRAPRSPMVKFISTTAKVPPPTNTTEGVSQKRLMSPPRAMDHHTKPKQRRVPMRVLRSIGDSPWIDP